MSVGFDEPNLYANNSVYAPDVGDFSWQEPEPDEGQVQDEADQEIVDGLSAGQLTIPEEGMQRLANNRNARVQIQLSQNLTPEQKQEAISQSFAADTEIRRAAMPPSPEQLAQSPDAQKQKLIAALPPEAQGKPWQFNPKEGNLQMPRGYKEPDAGGEKGGQGGGAFSNNPATVTDVVSESEPPADQVPTVTREQYHQLPPGSWYKHPSGVVGQKPFTPQQKMQRQFQTQYPGENWDDWKHRVWVQNPKTGLMEIDTTADKIKNPPSEKPARATEERAVQDQRMQEERHIKAMTDNEVKREVERFTATTKSWSAEDKESAPAKIAAYEFTIRPIIEQKQRDWVEALKKQTQGQEGQPVAPTGKPAFQFDPATGKLIPLT